MKLQAREKRNKKVLELYREGKTLQEIGEQFNFTRSRAQQIVIREVKKEILDRFRITQLSKEEKVLLSVAASEETQELVKESKIKRERAKAQETISRIKEKMKDFDHSTFINVSSYAKALNEAVGVLEMYFPEVVKDIVQRKKKMWSIHYTKCRSCGTTSIKHQSYGLCRNCFTKSDIFKDVQIASRIRNIDKRRETERAYLKEYYKRPEIKAKMKREQDLRTHGGNREKAMERDGYRCLQCGITKEDSLKHFGRDLYVYHVDDTNDNRLENLATLCQKCFNKQSVKLMRMDSTKAKMSKNM